MYRKIIKYTDYNGVEREEPFYFNLTKTEIIKWQGDTPGGLRNILANIIQTKDTQGLIAMFDEIIRRSYGEKSPDGKYFMKNPEILGRFTATEAYNNLFMELSQNDQAASDFVNGIIPEDLLKDAEEARKNAANEISEPLVSGRVEFSKEQPDNGKVVPMNNGSVR